MRTERNPLQEFKIELQDLDSQGAWTVSVTLFRPKHKNPKTETFQFDLVKFSNQTIDSLSGGDLVEVERKLDFGLDYRDLEIEFNQELWMEILPEL